MNYFYIVIFFIEPLCVLSAASHLCGFPVAEVLLIFGCVCQQAVGCKPVYLTSDSVNCLLHSSVLIPVFKLSFLYHH